MGLLSIPGPGIHPERATCGSHCFRCGDHCNPGSIFGSVDDDVSASKAGVVDDVTPTQRLITIAMSTVGVFAAMGAYTTIRIIGNRVHALTSVNYFAIASALDSTIAFLAIPGIGFKIRHGAREWILLLLLGVCGCIL